MGRRISCRHECVFTASRTCGPDADNIGNITNLNRLPLPHAVVLTSLALSRQSRRAGIFFFQGTRIQPWKIQSDLNQPTHPKELSRRFRNPIDQPSAAGGSGAASAVGSGAAAGFAGAVTGFAEAVTGFPEAVTGFPETAADSEPDVFSLLLFIAI